MSEIAADSPQRPRRRRRGGGDKPKAPFLANQLEWGAVTYLDDPTQPVDPDGVEAIHDASMRILEEIGILFLNDEALDILNAAGCEVDYDTKRVRMERGFVMEAVSRAPAQFTITPRNPAHEITIGGRHVNFGQVASAPNVMDLDRGRRVGNRADYQDLLRLAQAYNCIHLNCGYPVEPIDIPCLDPASRRALRHADADRQGDPRLFAWSRADRGCDGDGADRRRPDG
jgi:trimethylamine--corrinoid protein Co-methyltransferase